MRSRTKEREKKWVQTIRKDAKTAMEKKDKETRDKKNKRLESKKGPHKHEAEVKKMTEAIFERCTNK